MSRRQTGTHEFHRGCVHTLYIVYIMFILDGIFDVSDLFFVRKRQDNQAAIAFQCWISRFGNLLEGRCFFLKMTLVQS